MEKIKFALLIVLYMIPQEILEFVNKPGQAMCVGSVGKNLQPLVGRAMAVRTEEDKRSISFSLSKEIFEPHRKNIESNKKIAFNVTYPPTHTSYQLKGEIIDFADASDSDKKLTADSIGCFHDILVQFYGPDPAKHFLKFGAGDMVMVRMNVDQIFDQSPGPGAGKIVYPK